MVISPHKRIRKSAKRTRRVDDIDSKLFQFSHGRRLLIPVAKRCRALNGDAILAPQFHAIHLWKKIPLTCPAPQCQRQRQQGSAG